MELFAKIVNGSNFLGNSFSLLKYFRHWKMSIHLYFDHLFWPFVFFTTTLIMLSKCFCYIRDLKRGSYCVWPMQNSIWSYLITQNLFFKGGVNFMCLPQRGKSNKLYRESGSTGKGLFKKGLIPFLTNFFKVTIFTFILPLRLCHVFEHKFNFFFLHNSISENHA